MFDRKKKRSNFQKNPEKVEHQLHYLSSTDLSRVATINLFNDLSVVDNQGIGQNITCHSPLL